MIDAQSSNATATYYGEDTSDDPTSPAERAVVAGPVDVRHEPQGTSRVSEETGERTQRAERIFAPLELADDIEEDMVVGIDLPALPDEQRWRIVNIRVRTFDGSEGYVQHELADYGD